MDSRFDDLLNTVISQKAQGIYGFFDVMFSFLYRRTDFFYEMAPGENMGFFPSQAEAIVCGYFKKYQDLHFKERVPKRNIDPKVIDEYLKKKGQENNRAKEAREIIKKEEKNTSENKESDNKGTASKDAEIKKEEKAENKIENKQNDDIKPEKTPQSTNPLNMKREEPKGPVDNKPTSISTYNGDKCDQYNWSQAVGDVTIQFALKKPINKKQLTVNMSATHLKILIQGMDEPLIDDDFCEKINLDESNWSLEDGQAIIFFLEKDKELIWKSAFKGGKEIDTKTVDNSKRIEDFDSETQAALNKIMYEQNRKRNGLPTTEEEKKLEALKEAWNKPGSPFAGQPFDPSMFNLNEPIYMNTPDYEAKKRMEEEAKKNKK